MAKKKAKAVTNYLAGYVPATYDPGVTAKEIASIPPYPDSGVEYAGFAKRESNGSYQLLKQIPYRRTMVFSRAASGASLSLTALKDADKDIYISFISLDYGTDTGMFVDLYAYNAGLLLFRTSLNNTSGQKLFHFPVPLLMNDTTFDNVVSASSTSTLTYTIIGWQEKK
jgi:hypothetical protein